MSVTAPVRREDVVELARRYGLTLVALAITVGAAIFSLFADRPLGGILLVAAIGPPLTALSLAWAASGGGVWPRKTVAALIVGGTVVPALVIALLGVVTVAVWVVVGPLAQAATDLFDQLRVDPELLDVLTSPWALLLLVELAVVAPVGEETLKPLGALFARPGSRREAFLLGAAVGAGFAAIENVLYASGWFWSFDWWLPIAVLRSTGAALHLLGTGLISVALYERRHRMKGRSSVAGMWGLAVGIHAFWNGSIAVAIVLFQEQERLAGLTGSSDAWGTALTVVLAVAGMVLLGAIFIAARWASTEDPQPLALVLDFGRPSVVAGWASLAALMIVPLTIMLLVFPGFVAL